ncbi:2,3-bisphosphoglycerate-dependent phosphoglycerate mutase [Bacillus tianshenii]|uniref:2,3-bisphosphoglycerate-dependent phosphoglycerate mutase n=1 Tax=Sutcliffiella tianshenii TaxID=1463404 RepID=A0ABS2NYG7_9BACI|nr:histidine phosphatase family protein [Bacillus tianshenii]MBM7619686.1 2,3-bisphosphoglycerate-dependent phosphoglycerate mutase [Bacillus tianshenii]
MKTFIYMVRHGDSPKHGNERTRGLSDKGKLDAKGVARLLQEEGIDAVISSPYDRSVLTVQALAEQIGQEVLVFEDLKERIFTVEEKRISDYELSPLLIKSFSDPNFALTGGESNADCQKRAIKVFQEILHTYRGQKVVIGTHGAVMTLMMGYYDQKYDLDFLLQTTKPDIYRMEFDGQNLMGVKRVWDVQQVKCSS